MNLKEAILRINYDANWGIYAESPFTSNSPARIGQTHFENGGVLDDKEYFCNGEVANDAVETQVDRSFGEEDYQREVAAEILIDEIKDNN